MVLNHFLLFLIRFFYFLLQLWIVLILLFQIALVNRFETLKELFIVEFNLLLVVRSLCIYRLNLIALAVKLEFEAKYRLLVRLILVFFYLEVKLESFFRGNHSWPKSHICVNRTPLSDFMFEYLFACRAITI